MSKRNKNFADKLAAEDDAVPGWKDVVSAEKQEAVDKEAAADRYTTYKRKTYFLSLDLIDRIAAMAETEKVGVSELVRYLLDHSLSQIESGEHELPTQPAAKKIVP